MKNYIPTINISSLLKSDFNSLSANNTIKKVLLEKALLSEDEIDNLLDIEKLI